MRSVIAAALLSTLAVGACNAEPTASPAAPKAAPPPAKASTPVPQNRAMVSLDSAGLRLVNPETGSTRLAAFGSPAEEVHEAVSLTRSGEDASQGTNPDCGAGALDYSQWPNLILWFQNDAFVGWASNAPGPSTLNGISVGMTHVQLEQSGTAIEYSETSLGKEFAAGEIHGVVNDDGVVSNLWAGNSCNFD